MPDMEPFLSLVREYLALVENCEAMAPRDFLSQCGTLLPQIYAAGIQLPEPELSDEELEFGEREFESPMGAIGALLGKYDVYAEVFDPVFDRESLLTHLSDDLADIYADLREPLEIFDRGGNNHLNEALWRWRFNIRGHCGDHLVDALRPIHRLVFDHLDPEYRNEAGPVG
jgi:hypothetical protein